MELDSLFVLAGDDEKRLRRAALLIDLAKAKGADCVEILGAIFRFGSSCGPHPQSQPSTQQQPTPAAGRWPPSSATLDELLSRPPRPRGPALGLPRGSARPVQSQAPVPAPACQPAAGGGRKRRKSRRRKRQARVQPAAAPTLRECCSRWRERQQLKQQRRREPQLQPQPPPNRHRRNARRRRSAARSARCHAARRLQAKLRQGPLAIVLRFVGNLIITRRMARARQMREQPEEEVAQAKARAAAIRFERQQAAREAAAARKAAAQAATDTMDTSEVLGASSLKRVRESCPGDAAKTSGKEAHMGPGGCLSSQPRPQG